MAAHTLTLSTDKPLDAPGSLRAVIGTVTVNGALIEDLVTPLTKVVSVQATLSSGTGGALWVINSNKSAVATNGTIAVTGTNADIYNVLILGV